MLRNSALLPQQRFTYMGASASHLPLEMQIKIMEEHASLCRYLPVSEPSVPRCDYCGLRVTKDIARCDGCGAPQ